MTRDPLCAVCKKARVPKHDRPVAPHMAVCDDCVRDGQTPWRPPPKVEAQPVPDVEVLGNVTRTVVDGVVVWSAT